MNSKTFFVLLVFLLLIFALIGGVIGDTDLTPAAITIPGENKVVALPNAPLTPTSQNPQAASGGFPVTGGPCGSLYTVQKGDTLSQIARTCNLSLQDILSANPVISNPNLIRVGQQINIYYPLSTVIAKTMEVAPTATTVPPTAAPAAPTATQPLPIVPSATTAPPATSAPAATAAAPAATAAPNNPAMQMVSTDTAVKGPTGLHAGSSFNVVASGLPANATVLLSIGKKGEVSKAAGRATTSAGGVLSTDVTIPMEAKPGEVWEVMMALMGQTSKMIPPVDFVIEP